MNTTQSKIVVAFALAAIFTYIYFKRKNEELQASYDQQLQALQEQNESQTQNHEDFIYLNNECELVGQFKGALNLFLDDDIYNSENEYTEDVQKDFEKVLAGTTHVQNEEKALRRSFLYDICLTVANAIGSEIMPRTLKYEYTSGVLSLGDKGNEVLQLQILINTIYTRVEIENIAENSTYDKATYSAVIKLFTGTTALIDASKGTMAKEFVKNFTTIITNLKY